MDLAERLADLCEEQGRKQEARELRQECQRAMARIQQTVDVHARERVLRQKTTTTFEGEGLPLEELSSVRDFALRTAEQRATVKKVGRNDPCPCGSGRKFKKCCGGVTS